MQGANPRASYHATLQLDAGDHLGFAVGYGENHSNTNDTTGLALHIRRME
jgi:hypothetical protein